MNEKEMLIELQNRKEARTRRAHAIIAAGIDEGMTMREFEEACECAVRIMTNQMMSQKMRVD